MMDLPRIAKTALIGAGLGATFGLGSALLSSAKQKIVQRDTATMPTSGSAAGRKSVGQQYPYLEKSTAYDAVMRMTDYRLFSPAAYVEICSNMNQLAELHDRMHHKEPVKTIYEIRASRYRYNVQQALLTLAKHFFNQQPTAQFQEDADALLKVADDYMYNISQQMREHQARGNVKDV
jgi:hypothetical protein